MTFYTFMMRNYKNTDSPAGDLARDMRRDSEKFPRNSPCKCKGWYEQLYNYLVEKMPAVTASTPLKNAGRNM